jgi:hypothetical protein
MRDHDTGGRSNSSWFASAIDDNMDSETESPEESTQDDEDEDDREENE